MTQVAQMNGPMVFDFATGKLKPIAQDGVLPLGSLVSYSDMANPRKKYVIVEAALNHGGQLAICEDGHKARPSRSAILGPGGWELVKNGEGEPVILAQDEIGAFVAAADERKAREDAEQERAAKAAAQSRDDLRRQYLKEYNFLEKIGENKKSSHALGAANLRKLLGRKFPGVKFSVRSDIYSGGCSIHASWTDGPTRKEVEAICDLFTECTFDGMQDLKEYTNALFPDIFGGADFVFADRELTPERYVETARELGFAAIMANGRMAGPDGIPLPQDEDERIRRATWGKSFYTAPAAPAIEPAPAHATATGSPGAGVVSLNEEKNGVEIRFPSKPAQAVIDAAKAAGFRWSRFGGCWWHKDTPAAREAAAAIANL